MLNDGPGRNFRVASSRRFRSRGGATREPVRILIVDPVLGSRFLLAQAASQPGILVETASGVDEALDRLARFHVSLVIAEHRLASEDGLDFLTDLRDRHPETSRALVTAEGRLDFKRRAIVAADLAFVLTKPWSVDALRQTIREVIGGRGEGEGWARLPIEAASREPVPSSDPTRAHEVLIRGLLAGLNSCELETEVFELVHGELTEPFRIGRWLWIDEERELATRVAGDWPVEADVPVGRLSEEERALLDQARRSVRVTRLDEGTTSSRRAGTRTLCLALAIRRAGQRTMTALVWVDRSRGAELLALLRELQGGLQLAFARIRDADARARAARKLAERVSEELRTPVGALTHAINRLRGEVERAGMDSEWVDRVCSESERVVRAVEHLEGEMFSGQGRPVSPSS